MRKRFTLIELLIVIVVIGILSGVITGNVIDARKKAIISASNQELKNIQLATDIYIIKTNTIPVSEAKPELGRPVLLDIGKLYPEYLKKLPKKEFHYWIDHDNIVWSSSVPLPTDFSKKGNNISWNLDDEVQEYHIYDVENNSLKSIKTIKSNEFTITEFYDNDYAISAFDNYGFQTPPLLIEFSENEIPNLPEVPEPSPTPDNIENTKFREFYFNVYGGKGITTDGEALSWGYNDLEELYLVFNKYREYIPEYFVNTEDGMSFIYFYDIMFFSHIDNNYIEKNYENHLKGYFETSFGMDLPENITNDLKVFVDKVTEEIDDTMKFRATTELDIPNAKEIVSTSNGTYYAILENGTVMTWGSNYNGNLGLGEDDPYLDINTPTLIPSLSNVEKIINKNGETTFAITKNGEIYSWGYNSLRNACHTDVDTISVPTKIDSLSNNSLLVIDDIYQNNRTTFFKMKNGTVYYCGLSKADDSSSEMWYIYPEPTKINSIMDVSKMFLNNYNVIIQKSNGTVYGIGKDYINPSNKVIGEEGFDDYVSRLNDLDNAKDIQLSANSMVALYEDGTLKSKGDNTFGQLGLGHTNYVSTFTKISGVSNVSSIHVINDEMGLITYFCILNDGTVLGWGANTLGIFGLDLQTVKYQTTPTEVDFRGKTN